MSKYGVSKVIKLLKSFIERQNEDITSIPPAQDSPKHILNILNDDCLQAIFSKLVKNRDLLAAAEVCTRFQANAKICFPFLNITFIQKPWYMRNESSRYLNIFGPRIKSINYDRCNANLDLASQCCGNTLNTLRLCGKDNKIVKLRSPFTALKELHLDGVSFEYFHPKTMFSKLEILKLNRVKHLDWITNEFPMLKSISLTSCNLSDDIFIEFQKRNPQLERLLLDPYCELTSAGFDGIDMRLPNIKSIELSVSHLGESILLLGNLRYLKELRLFHSYRVDSLFSSLVKNNQPIEKLFIDKVDIDVGRILQQMKTIKDLCICNCSEQIVIDIAINLPALEFLFFPVNIERITISNILLMLLPKCKNLSHLRLYSPRLINLDEYNAIVALATDCLKVSIYFPCDIFIKIAEKQNKWVILSKLR